MLLFFHSNTLINSLCAFYLWPFYNLHLPPNQSWMNYDLYHHHFPRLLALPGPPFPTFSSVMTSLLVSSVLRISSGCLFLLPLDLEYHHQ